MTSFEISVRFFLELAFILGVCRLVGWLARCIQQPQVVGEMIAGVLMGPSLFGLLWPTAHAWMFPKESLTLLFAVSQVGIALYMFLVGAEFREDLLRQRARSAISVSLAGMLAPFALGAGIGAWLKDQPGFFGAAAHRGDAALFLGAAMAITAFPMLARIIFERGLTGTTLGTLALAAGAIDDAAAWCVLAVVMASLDHDWTVAGLAIGGGLGYTLLVLTVGRRALAWLGKMVEAKGEFTPTMLGFILMLVMLGAWFTDRVGIYAVFGAFIMGMAMPRGIVTRELQRQMEPLVVTLFLPLFFTYSGLKTQLSLVDSVPMALLALVILAAAILGKGGACYVAARWHGEDNRSALAIGTLMNARGLMELIILNIGLQRGVIQPRLFTIMVMMAIVTTLMATPLFEWVCGRHARARGLLPASQT